MTITKELLNALRIDIDAALATIAKARGLTSLRTGRCTYDPNGGNFSMKVEGVAEGGQDASAKLYDDNARLFGLPKRGTEFNTMGNAYRITGMKSGGRVIAERLGTGKSFLFKPEHVKEVTARKEAA
jgi:hypothetical protein